MTITSSGERPLALTHAASSAGICDSASVVFSMSAPSSTRKIIAVACAVPSALSIRPLHAHAAGDDGEDAARRGADRRGLGRIGPAAVDADDHDDEHQQHRQHQSRLRSFSRQRDASGRPGRRPAST